MDLGGDAARFIIKMLPTAFKISLSTGLIFPIGLYILEYAFEFDAPMVLYIICWSLAFFIFFKIAFDG